MIDIGYLQVLLETNHETHEVCNIVEQKKSRRIFCGKALLSISNELAKNLCLTQAKITHKAKDHLPPWVAVWSSIF
jgi:hypothetical protein